MFLNWLNPSIYTGLQMSPHFPICMLISLMVIGICNVELLISLLICNADSECLEKGEEEGWILYSTLKWPNKGWGWEGPTTISIWKMIQNNTLLYMANGSWTQPVMNVVILFGSV